VSRAEGRCPITLSLRVALAFRPLALATVMLLALSACGADDSAPPGPADGGAPDASCDPRLPNPWVPSWRPPKVMLQACTDAQIETEYRVCESESTYSATECAAFNRAAANAECRRCLYTTEDETAYGPLIYLRNRTLRINVPGCLALADGQVGATGCGAQMQAFQACGDAACMTTCAPFDAFTECVGRAEDGICSPYRLDSACGVRSTYAPCLDYTTFAEYYNGVAKLFCGAGFPDGGSPDAGANDAGADGGRSFAALGREGLGDRPATRATLARARLGAGEGIAR
jgi:hypothetical protein